LALTVASRPPGETGRGAGSPLQLIGILAAVVCVLPLLGVVAAAGSGGTADIAAADLIRYALTSAGLAVLVAVITGAIGTAAAWLVVMHRFPGRDIFAWALVLPFAMPAFALAYAYADLFDVAGDLRTWVRAGAGFDLPIQLRSLPGAAFVLSCAFYPYVYLAMRAAFVNLPVQALEAARSLGCTARQAFFRVAVPMARPALAAGVALAVMETLADYGAVQFLSVQTLTTGVVRAWFVYGSLASAAQFALPLLGAAALLLWIERAGRRGRAYGTGGRALATAAGDRAQGPAGRCRDRLLHVAARTGAAAARRLAGLDLDGCDARVAPTDRGGAQQPRAGRRRRRGDRAAGDGPGAGEPAVSADCAAGQRGLCDAGAR
jgi:ABC-type Fe3+ transport system permease subunit